MIKVGLISMGGGFAAMGNGTFANGENLLLSGVVEALGEALPERLAVNRQLQQEFGQFER